MKLSFLIPPPEKRTGGLDAAITGLRRALEEKGIAVAHEMPAENGTETVAHFHGLWQPEHARWSRACTARGIPVVISPHGMLEPWAWRHKWWKKWAYFHSVEKRHLGRAGAVLATASGEARRLGAFLPEQRIEALPLGLTGVARPDYENARAELGWRTQERVLLFLSRIHPKKGLDLFLRALAEMKRPRDVRLVIVGDGDAGYVRGLRQFAAEHALQLPRIDWIGAVWGEERWLYFQGADLFCLPTHSENFGLAVLEACQVGTPAMTTVDTPWAEHLADGRGFIGRAEVQSIRDTLKAFFARPRWTLKEREELADWAWTHFHWDALAARYIAFYESLLGSP